MLLSVRSSTPKRVFSVQAPRCAPGLLAPRGAHVPVMHAHYWTLYAIVWKTCAPQCEQCGDQARAPRRAHLGALLGCMCLEGMRVSRTHTLLSMGCARLGRARPTMPRLVLLGMCPLDALLGVFSQVRTPSTFFLTDCSIVLIPVLLMSITNSKLWVYRNFYRLVSNGTECHM